LPQQRTKAAAKLVAGAFLAVDLGAAIGRRSERGVEDDAAPGFQAGAAACRRARYRLFGRLRDQFDGIDLDAVEAVGQSVPDLPFRGRRATARHDGDPVGGTWRRKAGRGPNDGSLRPFGEQRVLDAGRADDEGATGLAATPNLLASKRLRFQAVNIDKHDSGALGDHTVEGFRPARRLQRREIDQP